MMHLVHSYFHSASKHEAQTSFAEYAKFLILNDPIDSTVAIFSVFYLLNHAADQEIVFAI